MNSINVIDSFLKSERYNKLIINQASKEICIFYINIIYKFCEQKRINIIHNDGTVVRETKDLFKKQGINLCSTNNAKIIETVLSNKEKYILITDYNIFKKYSKKLLSISGYNYDKDVKYYLQDKLKITNLDLLEFCTSTPQLAFSEISKFLINSKGYIKEMRINEKNNFILELRKELFNLKREGSDLRNIYKNLKNEAKYKKFNFLAF